MHELPHYAILFSHLFLQLKSQFLPQLPFLDHRQFIFSVNMAHQVSRTYKTTKLYFFIFQSLYWYTIKGTRNDFGLNGH